MRIQAIALLLLTGSLVQNLSAQDISFVWEPFLHQWEDGVDDPELVALNGYVTWKLYVQIDGDTGLPNEPEVFSSITGECEENGTGFLPLNIVFEPSAEMQAADPDTCCIYQHAFGQATPAAVNPALIDVFPGLAYDSWVTIGFENSSEQIDPVNLIADSGDPDDPDDNGQDWIGNFENCDVDGVLASTCTGGGFFTTYNALNTNAEFDENNQILIAQFTVAIGCTLPDASLCVQYFIDGDQGQDNVLCLELEQPAACFNNPMFTSITNMNDTLSCVGDQDGSVDFTFQGGSEDLSAYIWSTLDDVNPVQGPIDGTNMGVNDGLFENLAAGTYYIQIIDNITEDSDGTQCETLTDEFIIYEPAIALSLSSTIIQDVACSGLNEGIVQITAVGGAMPYDEPTCSFVDYVILETGAGVYEFSNLDSTVDPIEFNITDSLGCNVQFFLDPLGDPDDLAVEFDVTDISCFGQNNGNIDVTIASTGTPVVTWDSSVTLADPNSEDLSDLSEGWYILSVNDGVSCVYESDTIFITEPEELQILNPVPDFIDCFGDCNSTINYTISGGTGVITETINQGAGTVNNGELCAGPSTLIVTDENNCSASELVLIAGNLELFSNAVTTLVSCPEGNDGTICVTPAGGDGNAITTLSPASTFDPISNCYTGLTAGTYSLTVSDGTGCEVSEDIIVTQPDPFIVNIDKDDVSCFGLCDGAITTTNISGGTAPYEFSLFDGDQTITLEVGESLFSDLCPGNYIYSFVDADGCEFIEETPFVITEPSEIEITSLTFTSPGCGGECTATSESTAQGGTAPLIPFWNGIESTFGTEGITTASGLCADTDNTLSIIDGNGCTLDSVFVIPEAPPLEIVINSSNVTCTGMCDGEQTVSFTGGVAPYDFELPDIPLSGVCEGHYPVFVSDAVGCTALDTVHILADSISNIMYTVFTTPVSCWNENDGTATIAVTGGYGDITYEWSDPSSQNTATAIGLVEDFYTITIRDTIGCTFTENITIEPTVGCFFVADAITPNGDGFNDEWIIGGLEYFVDPRVEVFNRWGQLLYQSQGVYTPWDGKYNNERLPISDYYYVITFDPDAAPLTGTVTIKY